ncbi:phosphotransferase [Dyella flagellata]|uniref:Phosphotransferase n=1 Tax=Dyella flagellata TaxID=1867833 RepID=A0ABQ5X8L5_9GAMM|nr:phosphotransferase [Dyella flagellata]GLQ86895.1 phosphotransferase [Dyella flagellata]
MLRQEAWAARIPHAGAMALIDTVVDWSATAIHAVAERHALDEHPLRSSTGLHAVHLAEYGAQATAVHGALLGETGGREGRLVSLRDVRLAVEYVDLSDGRLDIHAHRLAADELGAQYRFEVEQQGQLLASGRVTVMYATGL